MFRTVAFLSLVSLTYASGVAPTREASRAQPLTVEEKVGGLRRDSALTVGKLENGITYMIRPTSEPKGRMSVRLYVDAGSLNEDEKNTGISHFIEHLEFNGSRTFKRGELIPAMQRLGLGFGGDANAYTAFEQTVYMLDLPNLNEETVDFAMKIMRDFGDGATMDSEAIEKERGIVVSELKTRDSLAYRAMVGMIDFQLPGTRVAHFLPIGKEEVIKAYTKKQVDDYYGTHYVSENMTLLLVGDITVEQGKQWAEKYFGSMPRKAKPAPREIGKLNLPKEQRARIFPNPEAGIVSLSVAKITPARNEKDTEANRLKEMPLSMAQMMLDRRFAEMVQRGDAPFLSASSNKESLFKTADICELGIRCNPEQWREALFATERELRGACVNGFSDAEFKEACSILENSLINLSSAWKTMPAESIAKMLIDSIGNETVVTDPDENMRLFRKAMETMTPEVCRKALCDAWGIADTKDGKQQTIPASLSATGNLPSDLTEDQLMAAYGEALLQKPAMPEITEGKAYVYEQLGTPGKVVQTVELSDLGVKQLTMNNGVRVNLKQTPFSQGEISVTVAVDGGKMSMPQGKPALHSLTGAVMNRGGLEAHSEIELQRLFAGKTVGSQFAVDDERFLFRGNTTPRDLEAHLKLLTARIMHPGYRPEGEIQFRRMLPAMYARLKHEPSGVFASQLPGILTNHDERFAYPEQSDAEKRTVAEVKEWLSPWLKEGAMEVTVVGDFDPTTIVGLIESTLGTLPQRVAHNVKVRKADRAVLTNGWKEVRTLVCESSVDKTIVAQTRPCGNGRDKMRNRRLQLLAKIFKERAFDAIRAELGESYGPTVSFQANDAYEDFALMTIASSGVLRNRYKVNAAMNIIATRLAQGTITQDELDRVLKPQLASVEKMKRNNDYWSAVLMNSQADPSEVEMIRNIESDLASVTLDEINELARTVFGEDNAAVFYVLPDSVPGHEMKGNDGKPLNDPAVWQEEFSVRAKVGE